MAFQGGGWRGSLLASDEKPHITWSLLKRALAYGWPYRWRVAGLLVLILCLSGLNLVQPLILRRLIDVTIPSRDLSQLFVLSGALLLLPVVTGGLTVVQRRLNASIGEGVIYDLRVALFGHLQRLSLRFFTHSQVGELMSRLNMDVVGAHNAISNTVVDIASNLIQVAALLSVMLILDWRLTLLSAVIFPLYFIVSRPMSRRLRALSRRQMETNAQMNTVAGETLSIGGALLVKLFGRGNLALERFADRAAKARDVGVRRAVMGSATVMIIGVVSGVGTALVYGLGGYFAVQGTFSIGTVVAFAAYLAAFYGALRSLANAPVEFATSMVSFERVFEVIDLPVEIEERPHAVSLDDVSGELVFEEVTFRYDVDPRFLLREVRRYGMMAHVPAVFSTEGHGPGPAAARPVDRSMEAAGAGKRRESADGRGSAPPSQARREALHRVSFRVPSGRLAALVGPSGAGKTTLTYLVPRL